MGEGGGTVQSEGKKWKRRREKRFEVATLRALMMKEGVTSKQCGWALGAEKGKETFSPKESLPTAGF